MAKTLPRIDEYIATSEAFAQPILTHIRKLVHLACPEVEEAWKWSFPHFDYKGMMFSMAAFKQHCSVGFWKASLLSDPHKIINANGKTAMGHLGQIKSLSDLPTDDILISYIKEAMQLNEAGSKLAPKQKVSEATMPETPDYLQEALTKNVAAATTFQNFSPSNRKEYILWLTEAKTEDTRNKRLQTTLEWLSEGKIRNWKYLKK